MEFTAESYVDDVLSGEQVAGKWVRLACERHRRDLAMGAERGLWFDEGAAKVAVAFFSLLRHWKGEWAGRPVVLEPWQQFIIWSLFGWKRADGSRRFRTCYLEVARKNGKALSLDTPVPTSDGWTTMGEVEVGDVLFDEMGNPCSVTFVSDVRLDRDCYEVEFSDGSVIVADAEHLWYTEARRTGRPGGKGLKGIAREDWPETFADKIRTTEEIRDTLEYDTPYNLKHDRVEWNHKVPVCGPLQPEQKELPIEPYVLGVWLGDGSSRSAQITCPRGDVQILEEIRRVGVPVREAVYARRGDTLLFSLNTGDRSQQARDNSVQARLRGLNLLGNKHIPERYLRGSFEQRLALLQGLMDTDGSISRAGQCEFSTTREILAEQVAELIHSLGYKCSTLETRAILDGVDHGPAWRILFTAYRDQPVFRLERKRRRLKKKPKRRTRASFRQIVAVRPVASVPVRCIQVDSPSHLFLVGRSMIPTHNTLVAAGIGLFLLVADGEEGAEVYSAATKRDQARISHNDAKEMVKRSPQLRRLVGVFRDNLHYEEGSGKFEPLGRDSDSTDGLNVHGVIADEVHAWKDGGMWDVLETGTGSRRQPLMVAITTAGFDRESLCFQLHDYAEKILLGVVEDDSFFGVVYALDGEVRDSEGNVLEEGDDWEDESVWVKANPNLGVSKKWDDIRRLAARAREMPARLNAFLRLHMNLWTQVESRWIDPERWRACSGFGLLRGGRDEDFWRRPGALAGLRGEMERMLAGRRCYGGLDLSSNIDLSAWVLVFPPERDGEPYWVLPRFWIPADNVRERVKVDRVPYLAWIDQGFVVTTPGNVIDYDFILARIEQDRDLFDVAEVAFDRWGATKVQVQLMDLGGEDWVVQFGQGFASMAPPMKELEKLILGRGLAHGGNPVLGWMAANLVARQDAAGNLKPDKEKSREKIDGVVGLLMGLDRAVRFGGVKESGYEGRGLRGI